MTSFYSYICVFIALTSEMPNQLEHGIVIPSELKRVEKMYTDYIGRLAVFEPYKIQYKGHIRWFGKVNDIKAYGIETLSKTEMGTNGSFNKNNLFRCPDKHGIIVKDFVKFLKIDEKNYFVLDKNFSDLNFERNIEPKYESGDLVVVSGEVPKVGKCFESGTIDDIHCYGIKFNEDSNEYIYASNDILGKFASPSGLVEPNYDWKYAIKDQDDVFGAKIGDRIIYRIGNNKLQGPLKWKGLIAGFKCLAIDSEDSSILSDFRKQFSNHNAYWAVLCLDAAHKADRKPASKIYRQISRPEEENILTYFRKGGYVKQSEREGAIKEFLLDEESTFYYEIKWEDNEDTEFCLLDEVKCASPTYIDHAAFQEVMDPSEFGIITNFTLNDRVRVRPTRENELERECSGLIVWMGFDQDSTFKFFLRLDLPNDKGQGRVLFGHVIANVPDGHGLLVLPSCLVPDVPDVADVAENTVTNKSDIVVEYQYPRSFISAGKEKGIQGDRNSCYMDTSLFAMFTFQEIFDNLLFTNDTKDSSIDDLQKTLRSHIIFPLRRDEYVSYDKVSIFRSKLNELFPTKKFIHTERDPEELLETLFHFLTPNDPLLNTFHIKNKAEQSCFLTQIFYVKNAEDFNVNILDMLNWSFLEAEILIDKPPKCLILQLPRHGTKYKKYDEVTISPTLDITHLIRCCKIQCRDCTRESSFLCKKCSDKHLEFEYFCSDHKNNCNHEKFDFKRKKKICSICAPDGDKCPDANGDPGKTCVHNELEEKPFKGKVVLELFAILCIEKTHYVAYVKTREVTDKWVYFDSMASFDDNELKPLIRQTHLGDYFQKNGVENSLNEDDILKIKKHAFVCFYKNPAMEYYVRDFNHIKSQNQ